MILSMLISKSNAQEVRYVSVETQLEALPAQILDERSFKTFDVKIISKDVLIELNANDKKSLVNTDYTISLRNMQQVDGINSNGDLHVIVALEMFNLLTNVKPDGGAMKSFVSLTTYFFSSDGNHELYKEVFKNESFETNYNAGATKEDISKQALESAIQQCVNNFFQPRKLNTTVTIADLKGSKNIPELKILSTHEWELQRALDDKKISKVLQLGEEYLPIWQNLGNTYAGQNVEDVKRAVYQNMAVYYILKGDTNNAKKIIAVYKPIDKEKSAAMTFAKMRFSDELEKLMLNLYSSKVLLASADKVSSTDVAEMMVYHKTDATVTIDDKKEGGTYNGVVYIKYPMQYGKIETIGTTDCDVVIKIKDSNKVINTKLSKIVSMQDATGKQYSVNKVGANFVGDRNKLSFGMVNTQYILMKETFASERISLFRTVVPKMPTAETSFLIKKAGDAKGVRTTYLNMKKNLIDYLSNCSAAVDMINTSTNLGNDIEQIVKTYSTCN